MTCSRATRTSGGGGTAGTTELVENVYRFHVPPGRSVLEIGCGTGDLLAALEPGRGVGVDLSRAMVDAAQRRHPHLQFEQTSGEKLALGETFDVIVLSDLVPTSTTWSASSTASKRTALPIRA